MKYIDYLRESFIEKELDWHKACDWFNDHPFSIDIKLGEYPESLSEIWYKEIFSENYLCTDIKKRVAAYEKIDKKVFKDLVEVMTHYFRRTVIGMLKYCVESTGYWYDVKHKDTVWRISWFHHVIANALDNAFETWARGDTGDIVLVSTPPQHLKSTLLAGGIIPLIMGNYPYIRGIITSYSDTYSKLVLSKDTMATIGTKGYTELFGRTFNRNLTTDDKKKLKQLHKSPPADSASEKETTKGGAIIGGGMSQMTGNPAQIMCVDDPIKSAEQARSPTMLDNICQEYHASVLSRIRDRTILVIAQTRWCLHKNTLVMLYNKKCVKIEDINIGDFVISNDNGKVSYKKVLNKFNMGKKPTFKIKLSNGNEIIATEEHRFLRGSNEEN